MQRRSPTAANVIVQYRGEEVLLLRPAYGDIHNTVPILQAQLDLVARGALARDAQAVADHLIELGITESQDRYRATCPWKTPKVNSRRSLFVKVDHLHSRLTYIYVLDLGAMRVRIHGDRGYHYRGKFSDEV